MRLSARPPLAPDRLETVTAVAIAFLIGSRFGLPGPLDLGIVAALLLIPVWFGHLTHGIRIIGLLGTGAVVSGLILNGLMSTTHELSSSQSQGQIVLILQIVVGSAALYWVRTVVGPATMALSFGTGILLVAAVAVLPSSENGWKFFLAFPVSVCALALAWMSKHRGRNELLVVSGLITTSALNDTRSTAAIMGTVLLIQLWTLTRKSLRLRSTPIRVAIGLAFIGSMSYFVMQAFLLEGFLGEGAQLRTEQQIEKGGSLLAGGRPEMGASLALIRAQPWGYGVGTLPSAEDITVAKNGMSALNYDPDNGYVTNYMFGSGFEVHSVVGDLWIRFGLLGILFLIAILTLVLTRSLSAMAHNQARALATFVTVQCIWEAFFSPLWTTSIYVLILAIALLGRPPVPHTSPRRAI